MPAVVTDLGLLVLSAAIYFGLRYLGDNNREDMEVKRCAAAICARGEKK